LETHIGAVVGIGAVCWLTVSGVGVSGRRAKANRVAPASSRATDEDVEQETILKVADD